MGVLEGKTAWITGGGTGIGGGIACALAEAGVDIMLSGRRVEPLEETAKAVRAAGRRVLIEPMDVTDREAVRRAVDRATQELGGIDILVNNAGINTKSRMAMDMSPSDWDRVVEVNLTGAFNCFQAVFPQMKKQGAGRIVNISSIAGRNISLLGGAAYTASKHGMVSLSHSINLETAEFGIRSCVICPGEVDTPLIAQRPQPVSEKRQSLMLQPEDLGAAVVFVASLPPHVAIPEMWIMPAYMVSGQPMP